MSVARGPTLPDVVVAVAIAVAVAAGACAPAQPTGTKPAPAPRSDAIVNLGPDLRLLELCGSADTGPVVSVSNLGGGVVSWTATMKGAEALTMSVGSFDTQPGMVDVANVNFTPPPSAVPGDAFDGVVTVSSVDGAFATGTVAVHAEIVAPKLTLDQTEIDFGDLASGAFLSRDVTFRNDESEPIIITAPPIAPPFTFLTPGGRLGAHQSISLIVGVSGATPGDYAAMPVWQAFVRDDIPLPAACGGNTTLRVHARIVAN
jgi:hypothetical protein